MRFTAHARRRLKQRGIGKNQVERVASNPHTTYHDKHDHPCFVGLDGGRNLKVVVAADDPELVITAYFLEED
jgi:hypothetical protein